MFCFVNAATCCTLPGDLVGFHWGLCLGVDSQELSQAACVGRPSLCVVSTYSKSQVHRESIRCVDVCARFY